MSRIAGYVCLNAALAAGLSAASLGGTVYDQTGAVVPNAAVRLFAADNTNQTVNTNAAGQYSFQVAPGRYRLQVSSPGFAMFSSDVNVQNELKLPVFLRLGMVVETMEVSADLPPGVKPQPGVPLRIRVGGNVGPVKMARMLRPAYPPSARERGVQGAVTFRCLIAKDGTVTNLTPATDADAMLVEAASAAVREWRYQPATLDGQPMETEALISVTYRLK